MSYGHAAELAALPACSTPGCTRPAWFHSSIDGRPLCAVDTRTEEESLP